MTQNAKKYQPPGNHPPFLLHWLRDFWLQFKLETVGANPNWNTQRNGSIVVRDFSLAGNWYTCVQINFLPTSSVWTLQHVVWRYWGYASEQHPALAHFKIVFLAFPVRSWFRKGTWIVFSIDICKICLQIREAILQLSRKGGGYYRVVKGRSFSTFINIRARKILVKKCNFLRAVSLPKWL